MEQFADNSKKKTQNRIKNILEAFEHIVDMAKDTCCVTASQDTEIVYKDQTVALTAGTKQELK